MGRYGIKIVKNYYLYRNKDDFKNLKTHKITCFSMEKILYFINLSVKCIFRQIKNEIVKNQDLYMNKDDF